jgi:hypothetical protein
VATTLPPSSLEGNGQGSRQFVLELWASSRGNGKEKKGEGRGNGKAQEKQGEGSAPRLVGLVKLPLPSPLLPPQGLTDPQSLLPHLLIHGYRDVINPFNGTVVGQLEVALAIGEAMQVQRWARADGPIRRFQARVRGVLTRKKRRIRRTARLGAILHRRTTTHEGLRASGAREEGRGREGLGRADGKADGGKARGGGAHSPMSDRPREGHRGGSKPRAVEREVEEEEEEEEAEVSHLSMGSVGSSSRHTAGESCHRSSSPSVTPRVFS